jgi:photosystem II stability/assembly factor-like uncharacterized protein
VIGRRLFLAGGASTLILPGCVARREAIRVPLAWQKLPTVPYRGKQDDIAFESPGSSRTGWYGNGEGRLYTTTNGGDAWEEIWHKPGTFIRALGFVGHDVGVLGNVGPGAFPNVTDEVPLYRTTDGGRSWAAARIEGPAPGGICGIDVLWSSTSRGDMIVNDAIMHAAGRVGGPAHYLRSDDYGASWTSRDLSSLAGAIYDVRFIDRRTGFLAASSPGDRAAMNALILRTEDGGASWGPVYRGARGFETVWKIHFPTRRTGYASVQSYDPNPAASRRFIVRTDDGGRTWTELPLLDDHGWRSFGIGFADERLGWVGGNQGGLETRDGGATWSRVEMGRAVNKIRFVGWGAQRRAFAIGSDVYRLDIGASRPRGAR